MDTLTPEQRRRNMQHIRSRDSEIEVILRRALWKAGFRYRKNWKGLPGKPDIAITKERIAVFCDSEFFHGKDWENLEPRLQSGANADYWLPKITRNMERDREVDRQLRALGWTPVRFWGKDIKKNVEECVRTIKEIIFDDGIEKFEEF